jgi:alginate O-acetyltransferase complex protein AlgJ
MQRIYHASRYLLTVLFVAYAVFANAVFFQKVDGLTSGEIGTILKGTATAQIDSLYKESLPHREPSIGLMGAARYLAMGDGRTGVIVGQDNWLFTQEEARAMSQPMDQAVAPIAAIQRKLAARGIDLVLLPVPAKLDVARDKVRSAELAQTIGQRYDLFLRELRNAGVGVVDTRAAMLAMGPDRLPFFATDTHWTAEGADAVARAVAASGRVASGASDFTVQGQTPKAFTGDLVSYVTTKDFAALIGLPPEGATPYTAVDSTAIGDLFASEGADVALVGTSYSANPDWSFAEALKLALHRDVLNYAEQGQGPVKPMIALLQSDDLRETPPQVILWEFPVRYLADPTLWDGAQEITVASNER